MKKMMSTVLVGIALILNVLSVNAQDMIEGTTENVTYTIEPVVSELQMNKSAGYFHLHVKPDTKETLEILIHNNGDKESTYEMKKDIAKTNKNGVIVYDEESAKGPNDSLEYNIEDILTIEENVLSVPAHSTKKFKVKVDMKDKKFEGILLGAFTVEEVKEESNEAGIGQEYLYELGIILTQNKESKLPNSKSLDLGTVQAELIDGRKVLSYDILNLEPNIARNLNIATKLSKTDVSETIFDEKVEKYSIAPNGTLPLRLDWKRQEVKSGTYLLEINAEDGEESWSWTYEFTIEQDEAKDMNENATYIVRYPKWTLGFFLVMGILTICNTLFLVRRQIKHEKEKGDKKENERKHK